MRWDDQRHCFRLTHSPMDQLMEKKSSLCRSRIAVNGIFELFLRSCCLCLCKQNYLVYLSLNFKLILQSWLLASNIFFADQYVYASHQLAGLSPMRQVVARYHGPLTIPSQFTGQKRRRRIGEVLDSTGETGEDVFFDLSMTWPRINETKLWEMLEIVMPKTSKNKI